MEARGASLPDAGRLLAVTAHPDDESFGLGALLAWFMERGTQVSVLCLTQGESSAFGAEHDDLATVRREELDAALHVLGIRDATVLSYPDGRLAGVPLDEIIEQIRLRAVDSDAILVFDEGGITGHPDHCRATCAAMAAARTLNLPLLAWSIPHAVARRLNDEFGTSFVGRDEAEIDVWVDVDRSRQLRAISCHRTQAVGNAILWKRLELLGDRECLRYLRS